MGRALIAIVALAATCSEPPRHAAIRSDPRYRELYPDRASNIIVDSSLTAGEQKLSRAGVFPTYFPGPPDVYTFLGQTPPWEGPPVPLPPMDDPYALIQTLTRQIEKRPDDPVGYELRADVWEELGWPARARRDRDRARALRGARE